METLPDFTDLREILKEARNSSTSTKSIWCTPSVSFETRIAQRKGILLGGAWAPQFLRQDESAFSVPFVRVLGRPRVLMGEKFTGSIPAWLPLLEQVAKQTIPLLLVAKAIDDTLLRFFIVNAVRGTLAASVARMEGSVADFKTAFGNPVVEPPNEASGLPMMEEAWLRKDASVVFPQFPENCQSITQDITVIEVGGEDFDNQQARLRFLSDAIRRSDCQHIALEK